MVTILDSAGRREFTEGWVGDWPENAAVKLEIPGRKKAEFPCGERQGAAIRLLRGQLGFSCSVDHFSGMGAKHELYRLSDCCVSGGVQVLAVKQCIS